MIKSIPLWVICDGEAHGPFTSVPDAWDCECRLRPTALGRIRDTRMVHATDATEALASKTSWYPRID